MEEKIAALKRRGYQKIQIALIARMNEERLELKKEAIRFLNDVTRPRILRALKVEAAYNDAGAINDSVKSAVLGAASYVRTLTHVLRQNDEIKEELGERKKLLNRSDRVETVLDASGMSKTLEPSLKDFYHVTLSTFSGVLFTFFNRSHFVTHWMPQELIQLAEFARLSYHTTNPSQISEWNRR